jgi:hypothetical protein
MSRVQEGKREEQQQVHIVKSGLWHNSPCAPNCTKDSKKGLRRKDTQEEAGMSHTVTLFGRVDS